MPRKIRKEWKTAEISIPIKSTSRKVVGAPVRTRRGYIRSDGRVVQIRHAVILPEPCGTIEDFNEDYAKATQGLVDVVLQMETNSVVMSEDESYPESRITAIGWREELTSEEKSAIAETTFSEGKK